MELQKFLREGFTQEMSEKIEDMSQNIMDSFLHSHQHSFFPKREKENVTQSLKVQFKRFCMNVKNKEWDDLSLQEKQISMKEFEIKFQKFKNDMTASNHPLFLNEFMRTLY